MPRSDSVRMLAAMWESHERHGLLRLGPPEHGQAGLRGELSQISS